MKHGDIPKSLAQTLTVIREQIAKANIPPSALDETLKIATWNIRRFGAKDRSKAAIHCIAEILNQFDLIAITELNNRLGDLSRTMKLLGPYWRVIYNDTIMDRQGNQERIGYLFDSRVVRFTGLAAEADPARQIDPTTGEALPAFTFWRAPFIASFQAGTFDFILVTAHTRWGSKAKDRLAPIKGIAQWIKAMTANPQQRDKDIILMGDFNIPSMKPRSKYYRAITSGGLRVPPGLEDVKTTTLSKGKRYDQILHYPQSTSNFTGNGGTVDFWDHGRLWKTGFGHLSKTRFTHQLSDHLPLWVEINVDTEQEALDQILNRYP